MGRWVADLPAPEVRATSFIFSSSFAVRSTQDDGFFFFFFPVGLFFVAELGGLTKLSYPGYLPPRRGGGGAMVVAPSEQKELQNPGSVGILQGREQRHCTWTALGLHPDPASSCWVVSLRLSDLGQ